MRPGGSVVDWSNPYRQSAGTWHKGDLHIHTASSRDGEIPEDVLLRHFEVRGYRFVAVTDHNLLSSSVHPPSSLTVLEGIEADFDFRFHTNVIHFDRRRIRHDSTWSHETFLAENARGGCLVILNHPNWGPSGHYSSSYLRRIDPYDGIEIYNAGTEDDPGSPLATDVWDSLLSSGKRVLGFTNQDVHELRHVKDCGNMVRAPGAKPREIFRALKQGNFYCYCGVEILRVGREGQTIGVETRNARSIRFIGHNGQLISEERGRSAELELRDGELYAYVRIECRGNDGGRSWTQPFFRD